MRHGALNNYIRDFIARPFTLQERRVPVQALAAVVMAKSRKVLLVRNVHRAAVGSHGGLIQRCARCGVVLNDHTRFMRLPGYSPAYFKANAPVQLMPSGGRVIDLDACDVEFCHPILLN